MEMVNMHLRDVRVKEFLRKEIAGRFKGGAMRSDQAAETGKRALRLGEVR
jgi:hypothetical protein